MRNSSCNKRTIQRHDKSRVQADYIVLVETGMNTNCQVWILNIFDTVVFKTFVQRCATRVSFRRFVTFEHYLREMAAAVAVDFRAFREISERFVVETGRTPKPETLRSCVARAATTGGGGNIKHYVTENKKPFSSGTNPSFSEARECSIVQALQRIVSKMQVDYYIVDVKESRQKCHRKFTYERTSTGRPTAECVHGSSSLCRSIIDNNCTIMDLANLLLTKTKFHVHILISRIVLRVHYSTVSFGSQQPRPAVYFHSE